MNRLSYQTLHEAGYSGYLLKEAPERILQFGEGNFMRAFVEHFVDVMNERAGFDTKVVLVQPRAPHGESTRTCRTLTEQEGLYTLLLRGMQEGKRVEQTRIISCVSRCLNSHTDSDALLECASNPHLRFITCNTTEAGIVYDPSCRFTDRPAASFPAKLTQFLYARYRAFGSQPGKGFVILACELIDDNGKELERCVLRHAEEWKLEDAFLSWLTKENLFCSTLVDRIVTGYPAAEAAAVNEKQGWEDRAMVAGEVFASWVIEGPSWLKEELPFEKAELPVLITDDHKPYKQRKVRILNGAHTCMVPGAFLSGRKIVRDCMEDPVLYGFLHKAVHEEIIPTLTLPAEELADFADSVEERFRNPFIDHALLSITLNCTAKWRARVLPSLVAFYEKNGSLPVCLTASLALYLAFYRGRTLTEEGLVGNGPDGEYLIRDDKKVLEFFHAHRNDPPDELVRAVCKRTDYWGMDLTSLPGLEEAVCDDLKQIERDGAYELIRRTL